jgi:hypothetical protein
MSRFNDYAKKLNEIANGTFEEYRRAEAAVKSAESRYNAYPRRNGADPAYMAKSTRAEADLAEARNAFEQMRRHLFDDKRREIAAVRAELEKAVGDAFAADPTKVDMQTMELLRSGIMSADEYNRLIDKATANGNPTMARMIAQSAADMAERTKGDADVSRSYRLVSHKGKGMNGQEYLDAFDCLCRTFNRCERNFALSTKWDELTSPIVDSF